MRRSTIDAAVHGQWQTQTARRASHAHSSAQGIPRILRAPGTQSPRSLEQTRHVDYPSPGLTHGVVRLWLDRAWSLFAPPPKLNVAQWANTRRRLARGTTAEPGKYRSDRLPYQHEPMEGLTDPAVTETILIWARQLGKTEVIQNLIGWGIDYDPSNIFVVYPTKDKAKAFSQKKLMPMIRATPELRDKVKPARTRDSGNSIYSKLYPGGAITMAGANSPATLRGDSNRIVIQDEIDADELNQEGDPVPQADATATNFHDAIFLKSSTPTIEPTDDGKGGVTGSRIQILFDESDQRYWNVPCPRCNHWQTLKWAQVRWTWKQEDATEISDPEKACYVCEACQAELTDFERVRMVMHGRWVAKNPSSRRRGYHLSGLYRIMGKKRAYRTYLHEFVEGFLKAKREGTLEVWTNCFLAECWSTRFERLDVNPIMEGREHYGVADGGSLPQQVLVLTTTVDVQADRLECMVRGWGLLQESWAIERKIIMGNPHGQELWKHLANFLATEYPHPTLGKLRLVICLIDSGGQSNDQGHADPVYRFVRPRQPFEFGPGVYASKGSSSLSAPLVSNRRPKKGICLKLIGTSVGKLTFHSRLHLPKPGARCYHYPHGCGFDDEFYAQLAAEVPKQVKRRGFTYTEWHKIRTRNEGLDLEVLHLAAFEILNPDLPTIARRAQVVEPTIPEERPAQPRRQFRMVRPKFGPFRPIK